MTTTDPTTNTPLPTEFRVVSRTHEHGRGHKLRSRITDDATGVELFYGDPDAANKIMAQGAKPGQILRCETFSV